MPLRLMLTTLGIRTAGRGGVKRIRRLEGPALAPGRHPTRPCSGYLARTAAVLRKGRRGAAVVQTSWRDDPPDGPEVLIDDCRTGFAISASVAPGPVDRPAGQLDGGSPAVLPACCVFGAWTPGGGEPAPGRCSKAHAWPGGRLGTTPGRRRMFISRSTKRCRERCGGCWCAILSLTTTAWAYCASRAAAMLADRPAG